MIFKRLIDRINFSHNSTSSQRQHLQPDSSNNTNNVGGRIFSAPIISAMTTEDRRINRNYSSGDALSEKEKVKKLNSSSEFYMVSDGKGNYYHGETIKEANEDLIYKITDRKKSDYEDLTLDSKLTFADSVSC